MDKKINKIINNNYFLGEVKFLLFNYKEIREYNVDCDEDRYENNFLNILEILMLKVRFLIYKY